MEEYISKDLEELKTLAAVRSENLIELTLNAVLEKVEDRKNVIDSLFASSTNQKANVLAVVEFLTRYVEELLDKKMVATEYIEKDKSKQRVHLYIGTHWVPVDIQLYYVFVKRCCGKMGLVDLQLQDPQFMAKVCERLAYRVMDYRKLSITPGDVWINLQNLTLEIKKDGSLVPREHRMEDFFTYVLPYVYDENAECPLFRKFLDRVLPDKDMQNLLAEYIGYCFSKNLKLERMLVCYGFGSNGKSVLLDLVTKLLGACNVSNVTLSNLTTDDEKRSLIEGKLANISHESNGELDTAMLKQIVSGEPTEVRVLYKGTHTMTDIPKLFTSYNRLPPTESTYGFFRRWILLPFNVTIPEEEQDVELVDKLAVELPGILNWALESLARLVQRKAFSKSEGCKNALSEYIKGSNSALNFLSTKCIIDEYERITLNELYKAYTQFCTEEDIKRFGKKNFQEILKNFGGKATVSKGYIRYNLKIRT